MAKVKRKAKRKITSKKKKVSTTGITKTIEKLISKGKEKGFLTYDEINNELPEDMLSLDILRGMAYLNLQKRQKK